MPNYWFCMPLFTGLHLWDWWGVWWYLLPPPYSSLGTYNYLYIVYPNYLIYMNYESYHLESYGVTCLTYTYNSGVPYIETIYLLTYCLLVIAVHPDLLINVLHLRLGCLLISVKLISYKVGIIMYLDTYIDHLPSVCRVFSFFKNQYMVMYIKITACNDCHVYLIMTRMD